jgi:acetamidase/formamidase
LIHELSLERRNLHGHFSRDLRPALTIDPGDTVDFSTPSSGWMLDATTRFEPRSSPEDDGHALAGPIEVRGAREDETLVVRVEDVTPGAWGETHTHPPHRIEWRLESGRGYASTGQVVALRPFLGVMGMPPIGHGVHSTTPPRRQGGNIDCKELVAGTTLYLPISVDGAHFSAGDGHAAQGDGEVSGTAIECFVEHARLTIDLSDLELRSPIARTDDAWIAFGFDEDLDLAADEAMATMLDLIERELELDRSYALALSSVAVDLRVTQIVNGVKGVHAVLADGAIEL